MNYLILSGVGFGETMIRKFFGVIDGMIYGLFGMLIKAYFKISDIDLLAPALQTMKTRLYIFVALFMIFRVSISLLQAMVNPDIANDKKNGVGNLVSRVAVSLVLLVAVPVLMDNVLFGSTNGVSNQQIIASIIPKIILGTGGAGMTDEGNQDNIGQLIASSTYNAFFTIDEECGEGEEYKLDNMKVSSMIGHVSDKCENEHKDKYYKYEYSYFISTLCGAIMIIMVIGYSLDVVTRILKLQILQVLAPIPIVAYIDPGKGKDTLFSTWLKTLVSTYCDFFIKLASLYFVIFIMLLFIQNQGKFLTGDNLLENGYILVIVILGLLLALKQLPEFISSLFGIKSQGFGAGLGTFLGAAAGLATGGLAGMVSGGLAGAADGGKSALGSINKGKDAGKKTNTGKQRQMNKQQKLDEKLRKRYGLDDEKAAAKKNLEDINGQVQQVENEYERAKASGNQERMAELQAQLYGEDGKSGLKAEQSKAQTRYDDAKKYYSDPHKAVAEGRASTRVGAAVRYAARHTLTKGGDDFSQTGVGRAIGNIAHGTTSNGTVNSVVNTIKNERDTVTGAQMSRIKDGNTASTRGRKEEAQRLNDRGNGNGNGNGAGGGNN